jgi:hypothetical protein
MAFFDISTGRRSFLTLILRNFKTQLMARKIAYWLSTGLVVMSVIAAFVYLSGSPQAVQGFARVAYPQHLRMILGIANPLA